MTGPRPTTDEGRAAHKKARRAAYYQKHKAKILAYAEAYRANNAEVIQEKAKGKHAAYSAKYRDKNYEKCLQMTQAWKDANPDQRKSTNKTWKENNYSRHLSNIHNHRMRKKNGGVLSKDIVNRLYILQKGKCACCRKPLNDDYELDHIVPLSRGGSNTDKNVQLLTTKCNRQKGAKSPELFMQSRGMLL